MIRAAGGVVWRRGVHGQREVALVSRPKYGDWTLPKGKLDPGETPLAAAVREVFEETGQRVRPGVVLGETRYTVHRRGEPTEKVVDWWAMEALGGSFVPGDEISEVAWLPLDAAARRLSYDHERELLDRFARAVRDGGEGDADPDLA